MPLFTVPDKWRTIRAVGRKWVWSLMRKTGVQAINQEPRTTVPHLEHTKYPYLLRNMTIDRVNQVWCSDITYSPMRKGFLYWIDIMHCHSRKVLSSRLPSTMDIELQQSLKFQGFSAFGYLQKDFTCCQSICWLLLEIEGFLYGLIIVTILGVVLNTVYTSREIVLFITQFVKP